MKKKILTFILALCMILPCAFMLSACGNSGGGGEDDDQNQNDTRIILEQEWKSTISINNNFVIEENTQDNTQGLYNEPSTIEHNDGEIFIKRFNDKTVKFDYATYSKMVGDTTKYYCERKEATVSKYKGDTEHYTLNFEIDEETYNENTGSYMELIDFIGNNYSKFTYGKDDVYRGYRTYVYSLQVNDELESTNYAKDLNISKILVYRYVGELNTANAEKSSIEIDYCVSNSSDSDMPNHITFDSSLLRDLDNLDTFATSGGPGVDYVEYATTSNGFKVYTPEVSDLTQREAYLQFDKDTDKYVLYRQDTNGNWGASASSENVYNNLTAVIDSVYFAFKKHMNSFYMTSEGYKSTIAGKSDINDMKYNGYAVNYSDILITTDDLGNITGGTLKFKLKLGEAQSEEYVITLTTSGVSITFPEMGTHSHSYKSGWSSNDEYHWHACEDETCVDCQDKAKHDFDEGTIVTPASDTSKGAIKYTCTTCGKEITKSYTKPASDIKLPVKNEIEWIESFDAYEKIDNKEFDYFYINESVWDDGTRVGYTTNYRYNADGTIYIYPGAGLGNYTCYKIEDGKYIKYDVEDYSTELDEIEITKSEYDGVLAEHNLKNLIIYNDIKENYNYFANRYELDSYVFNGEAVTDIEIYFMTGYSTVTIYFTNSIGYKCYYTLQYCK